MTSTEDAQKFVAVFLNRIDYSHAVREEVKEWVAENIAKWNAEQEDWFKIDYVGNYFLPREILED